MCAATSHSTQQGTRGLPPRKRRRPTPLSDDAESETSAESGGAEPVESYSTGFEVYDPANYELGMGEVSVFFPLLLFKSSNQLINKHGVVRGAWLPASLRLSQEVWTMTTSASTSSSRSSRVAGTPGCFGPAAGSKGLQQDWQLQQQQQPSVWVSRCRAGTAALSRMPAAAGQVQLRTHVQISPHRSTAGV